MLHPGNDFLSDETAFRKGDAARLVEIDIMREDVIVSEIRFTFRYAMFRPQLCPRALVGRAICPAINPADIQFSRKAAITLD